LACLPSCSTGGPMGRIGRASEERRDPHARQCHNGSQHASGPGNATGRPRTGPRAPGMCTLVVHIVPVERMMAGRYWLP
jgi:hypothetical protein